MASGVPETSLIIDAGAADTFDSASRAERLLGSRAVLLVTSAGHMPRAMNGFEQLGFDVVPAPTDHKMPADALSAPLLPSAYHLQVSDLAIHEYAALLWYRVSGKTERIW